MDDVHTFGVILLVVGLAATAAVLANRVGERLRVPAPAIFLVAAAIASEFVPRLSSLSIVTVQRVVTVALVVLLFDGGLQIGTRQFRGSAGPILWLGVAGTFVTTGALALLAHSLIGLHWQAALLLGAALAPTDPAVVFAVLGGREISGRSGTILQGESGANDPVGIALLASLLGASGVSGGHAVLEVTTEFLTEMVVGAAVGIAGGWALLIFIRRVPLPSEALYPLRVLAGAIGIYGLATLAHGSGFLAVFTAGILLGDEQAPYKREIERFHSALAGLGEIVAFTVLGLTVSLSGLRHGDAIWVGLVIAVVLGLVIRPVLVGLLSAPIQLNRGERAFVLWAGLKGAVPILLGSYLLDTDDGLRLYQIVVVVVVFSVVVQGGLTPTVARLAGVPMRPVEPEPWAVGVRLRQEPQALRRFVVGPNAPAVGRSVGELVGDEDFWISLLVRDGTLVPVTGDTTLEAGDEVFALGETKPEALG